MAVFDDFLKLDIRAGTVREAEPLPKAKVPAIRMTIDFGEEIGMKQSSAQVTKRYEPAELIGKQVMAVVNFPPRKIAGFSSEVLVLGAVPGDGDVVLLNADEPVPNGTKIG
ncbi:chaperone CsaA [Salisediminibacterium selenitireducens]|uniref:Export-related chaperone CsaA n=1 Tax=Bacillus selenitireducens (strain ATCC 700615 / DSM 15326 / MLS10) TaxID=439292 RepID=D6XZ04_BACIE|nr:chaperone CsaA [Salisediminibacterium selenitireducens]ADI00289.1 export-related chaperone CsaA [[Bacillus] selenitireducens MLS10]